MQNVIGKRKRCDAASASGVSAAAKDVPVRPEVVDLSERRVDSSVEPTKEARDDSNGPCGRHAAELKRLGSGGDETATLKEKFGIPPGDLLNGFDQELDLSIMHPSFFSRSVDCPHASSQIPTLPAPKGSHARLHDEYQMPFASSDNQPLSMHSLPVPVALASSAAHAKSEKKKKRRKRMIDETHTVDPTAGDVLFGRGGSTNQHRGNVKFRQKALELRPQYERSTKEEKQRIADVLVESVTGAGHRFLERGKDGLWHEVIGNGAHTKASQALRERIKTRKTKSYLQVRRHD